MKIRILLFIILSFAISGCHHHENQTVDEHEEIKFQYTAYSDDFELYAEADPFVVGETANVLSHVTSLPEFRAFESGKISVVLDVNGKIVSQTQDGTLRWGKTSLNFKPETAGTGSLKYQIVSEKGTQVLIIPEILVYESHEAAHEAGGNNMISGTNTSVFTKEQSWKIDFSTGYPERGPFGQVIRTTGFIQPSPDDEMIITSKTSGLVSLSSGNMLEGRSVSAKQALFTISGSEMAENNFSVKFSEAGNNFEKARADYERAKELSREKIISEKDLLATKTQYENARVVYDNLKNNFNESGQVVTSPLNGFIKQVFVKNGTYVTAGQPIITLAKNKTLLITADVPQKYAAILNTIQTANIRSITDNQLYTLDQLNGKVVSYGKSSNSGNFLIPVNLQIENNLRFTSGSFVEIYLITLSGTQALSVPNSSLLEEQGIYSVYVQINPELFEKREVIVGATDGKRSEILRGLSENERIVTKGAINIKLTQSTGTLDAHSGHVH